MTTAGDYSQLPSATGFVPRLDEHARDVALQSGRPRVERRIEPRFFLRRPAVLTPVFVNLHPGTELRGEVVDIAQGGVGLSLDRDAKLPTRYAVIGIQSTGGAFFFATVEVCSIREQDAELRLSARFVGGSVDPLNPEGLVPRLDPATMRLTPTLCPSALSEWIARGVLSPQPLDVVKSCPRCRALPTFREGCLNCGSPNTVSSPLIHHYACAHVGRASEFEAAGALACPKCRARNLIVGADFEHLAGPASCTECEWSAAQPGMIGECLMCGLRFASSDAVNEEVTQFYVARLDPLALVDADA